MKKLPYRFMIFIIFIFSYNLFSQEIILKGKVRHANTHREISYVNIYIKNSTIGTTTDEKGYFNLKITKPNNKMIIVFDHIAFDTLHVRLAKAKSRGNFYIYPRIMQSSEISVEATIGRPDILKDLPQAISIIDAKKFEGLGYIDAGDVLKTDQSIQVEEESSGKKTIAIRAGNPEDVIVLYNGIKMNNAFNNIFDLSLISLEDIGRIEIIKGSNTSLYGSGAFSGIINIIPKRDKNYSVQFIQKFGSYDAGDWYLNLNHNFFKKLFLSYSIKKNGSKKAYSNSTNNFDFIENKNSYHTANIFFDLSDGSNKGIERSLNAMYISSESNFNDYRYSEKVYDHNQLLSFRYIGNIAMINNLNLSASYQWLDNEQQLFANFGFNNRYFTSRNFCIDIGKSIDLMSNKLLMAYQFENNKLDYQEDINYSDYQPVGISSAFFTGKKHGFVSIFKFDIPTESNKLQKASLDISYRYDNVKNCQSDVVERNKYYELDYYPGKLLEKTWDASTVKLSNHISGNLKYFGFKVFISAGNNVKFPTLFQQISSPSTIDTSDKTITTNLNPEKNRSMEIGIDLIKETIGIPSIDGWQFSVNYFKNYYENKFRTYYVPDIPIAFFDNVQNANISGIESKILFYLFRQKMNLELGVSRYFLSEKAAFPLKSDLKYVINISIDHAGFSLKLHLFKESEQIGWFRDLNGKMVEIDLPGYSNFDIHLNKHFNFYNLKYFVNFSARNVLDEKTELNGIAIRDRRFYISFGLKY